MKIEQKDKSFSPITLTIESQEELDLLSDLFCLVADKLKDDYINDLSRVANDFLFEMGANGDFTYIDGIQMDVIAK